MWQAIWGWQAFAIQMYLYVLFKILTIFNNLTKSQRGLRQSRPHVRKWERLQTVANHSGWSKHWAEARELKNQEAKNQDIIQGRVYLIHKHSLGINLSWTVDFYTEVFVERADSHTGQTRVSNKKNHTDFIKDFIIHGKLINKFHKTIIIYWYRWVKQVFKCLDNKSLYDYSSSS